ncbi:MAG TPA: hypothetical protein VGB04_02775 [Allosphingosinicella sp.]|jgi:hypothetical protein
MRNPGRKAVYCGLALSAAAALVLLGIAREERLGEDMTALAPLALGFAIVPFALYVLVEALFARVGLARLRSGQGVIARWQVQPGEWEQFRELDSRRGSERLSLVGALWIKKARPAVPVEVIVGERSVLVDGSYHSVRPGGIPDLREVRWLEGPPTCLEFALRYPRGRNPLPVTTSLRVPVPAGARGEAARVFEHYRQRLRPAVRAPSRAWRIGAALAAAVVTGWAGYALFGAWREGNPDVLPGLAIGAILLAIFAALIALASLLPGRRA